MSNKNRDLKKNDVNLIRECFYQTGIQTKNSLRQKTGISSGGITGILQELLQSGEILYVSDAASTGGRRSKQYVLNPDHAHIGTVSCYRTLNSYCFFTDRYACNGVHLDEKQAVYDDGTAGELHDEIQKMLASDHLIRTVVISIPGFCKNGIVQVCDFHELEGKNLKAGIPADIATVIENDVNVAGIGFYHEQKYQNMALIYQPDAEYSGAGLIIDGKLYNGADHKAGEMRYLCGNEKVQKLKDPSLQLWKEICAIQAVIDPEIIGWCSDITKEADLMKHAEGAGIRLRHVKNMNELIEKGMYEIGKNRLLKRGDNI